MYAFCSSVVNCGKAIICMNMLGHLNMDITD